MPSAPKVSLGFTLDGLDTRRWKTWAKKQTQRLRSMNGTCIQGGAFCFFSVSGASSHAGLLSGKFHKSDNSLHLRVSLMS